MRKLALSLAVGTAVAVTAPAHAQRLEEVISGMAQSLINQELERNAFVEAQGQNTVAAYRTFLQRFPNGANRANAEQAIERLGGNQPPVTPAPAPTPTPTPTPVAPAPVAPSTTPAGIEASLGLTRGQRIAIQQQLTSLGHSTGGADGLWGRNTRSAISNWQRANAMTATGYVTARQVRQIADQAGAVPTPAPDASPDHQLEERLLDLSSSERREVQRRLTALGYNTFGVDGSFGGNTRRALSDWQRSVGETPTGYLTADQVRSLRITIGSQD